MYSSEAAFLLSLFVRFIQIDMGIHSLPISIAVEYEAFHYIKVG